jgi:ABC-type lipoprotein release transport system permease subunit
MLSSATSSTSTQQSQFGGRGGMGGPAMGGPGEMFTQQIAGGGNVIRTIDTQVGVPEILLVLGVGLFVCFAGSGVAIYRIMKYEPMQILANRV